MADLPTAATLDGLEVTLIETAARANPTRARGDVEDDVRRSLNAVRSQLGYTLTIQPRPAAVTLIAPTPAKLEGVPLP